MLSKFQDMYRCYFLIFFINIFSLSVFAQAKDDAICKQQHEGKGMMQATCLRSNATILSRAKTTSNAVVDIHYVQAYWQVDPRVYYISGTVITHFSVIQPTKEVTIALSNALDVSNVSRNGMPLAYSRNGDWLTVKWDDILEINAKDSFSITYNGAPLSTGLESFVQSSHSGDSVMWTLSEPYGASEWWPTSNSLVDKIDSLDVRITTPERYLGVSNGVLVSNSVSAGERTTLWRHRYSIAPYLVCMAAGNYKEINEVVNTKYGPVSIQNFCYEDSYDAFLKDGINTRLSMDLFVEALGAYPFANEKYGHTEFGWGGGMEHQTNSFVKHLGEELTAHELAHQWFGDKVTCATWKEIWLNEGPATFLANRFLEERHPEQSKAVRCNRISQITEYPDGSVIIDDTSNISRIFSKRLTYLKAGEVLNMLEYRFGAEKLNTGLFAYLHDPKLAYGFATTTDFKRHIENAVGEPLDSFFRHWVYGEGYPSYTIEWEQLGGDTVHLIISQSTSHPSVSAFEMPVPLLLHGAQQQQLLNIPVNKKKEEFYLNIPFNVLAVVVDPECRLISKDNKVEMKMEDTRIEFSPNPMHELATLTGYGLYRESNMQIRLMDIRGVVIFQQSTSVVNGRFRLDVSLHKWLPKGVYVLDVHGDNAYHKVLQVEKM